MSSIPSAGSAANVASTQASAKKGNGISDLDLDGFLKLLISELQNQDPLNPMDNAQMVQQLSTIREIGATNQLTDTLGNLSITQQLSTASSLIGRTVDGLTDGGKEITGPIESVSVETDADNSSLRKIKVRVAGQTMEVKNIRQIRPEGA